MDLDLQPRSLSGLLKGPHGGTQNKGSKEQQPLATPLRALHKMNLWLLEREELDRFAATFNFPIEIERGRSDRQR